MKNSEMAAAVPQNVGIKESKEFVFFIGLLIGVLAKHAKLKSSFLFIAKDLISLVFTAQTAIEGFNQIGDELTDLTPDERIELEYGVRNGIVSQSGNIKVETVSASATTAAIAIYQAVRTLKG